MRTYKLEVVTPFKDIHTKEKYKAGKKLNNISEERAFELFSSPYHLVKFISCKDDENIESIKIENEELKAEIDNLKLENEALKSETSKSSDTEEKNQDE